MKRPDNKRAKRIVIGIAAKNMAGCILLGCLLVVFTFSLAAAQSLTETQSLAGDQAGDQEKKTPDDSQCAYIDAATNMIVFPCVVLEKQYFTVSMPVDTNNTTSFHIKDFSTIAAPQDNSYCAYVTKALLIKVPCFTMSVAGFLMKYELTFAITKLYPVEVALIDAQLVKPKEKALALP